MTRFRKNPVDVEAMNMGCLHFNTTTLCDDCHAEIADAVVMPAVERPTETTIYYDSAGNVIRVEGPIPRCGTCGVSLIGRTTFISGDGMYCEVHG